MIWSKNYFKFAYSVELRDERYINQKFCVQFHYEISNNNYVTPCVCAYLQLLPISSTCFSLFLKKKEWETHHFLKEQMFFRSKFSTNLSTVKIFGQLLFQGQTVYFFKKWGLINDVYFACQTLFTYVIVYDWC